MLLGAVGALAWSMSLSYPLSAGSQISPPVPRGLDGILSQDPPEHNAIQVADANVQPGRNAHFALDVIALDPNVIPTEIILKSLGRHFPRCEHEKLYAARWPLYSRFSGMRILLVRH